MRRRPFENFRAATLLALALALLGCGGGGNAADASLGVPLRGTPGIARGSLLQATWSAYPRLVRLAHQTDATHNGRIVASLTEWDADGLRAGFHASADDGASFRSIGTLRDPDFAGGLCCGTLFEVPQDVGAISAGTLLYAASVGADRPAATMENRLYRSDDAGRSFRRIDGASCGRAARQGLGVWEPEFFIAGDGSLACVFSDESQPGHSQVLQLTQTVDGVTWSASRLIVAGAVASDRPGMAVVRRLPGGRYVMSFEHCSSARLDCAARMLRSDDGLDWGAPAAMGLRPQTSEGQFFRHAPTIAGLGGGVVLIGQLLVADDAGVDLSGSGHAVLLGEGLEGVDGSERWRLTTAPIGLPVAPARSNFCQNYSSALLPSADGSQLIMMMTDLEPDGTCLARYGRATLAPALAIALSAPGPSSRRIPLPPAAAR